MWYLIVPPVVIIFSLAFLLWYLARKGADPVVKEKMIQFERLERPAPFSRTREFFLHLLEKWVQRARVFFLKVHNAMSVWSLSVRDRRRRVREEVQAFQEQVRKQDPLPLKKSFFSRWQRKTDEEIAIIPNHTGEKESSPVIIEHSDVIVPIPRKESLADPIVRRRKLSAEPIPLNVPLSARPETIRPMVSDRVAQPESNRRRPSIEVAREEELIAQIAVNPKDFTAYEALGDYYLGVDNVKDAKECYRQVLKLSPVHRTVKVKIRRLERLLASQSRRVE